MIRPIKYLVKIRLLKWYLAALVLFTVILVLSPQQLPVVIYKFSLVLLSAVVGYHLDRALFPYASPGGYLYQDWKIYGKHFYINEAEKDGENEIPTILCAEYPVLESYKTIFSVVLIRRAIIIFAVILGVTFGL
ncbi:putative holin [Orbaceae bacterium ESL0727]|nr:putative holin [Orbaceae bacterium ESL0727]MDF7667977.1 putative holin [Orbaceae bacterium ESL0727]